MNLVFSQSSTADAARREFEEELVAALVMRDRIDVSLVGDIADIETHSTDALCIEGVRGDMLCASWHAADTALQFLARMSVVGQTDNSGGKDSTILPVITTSGQYDPMQRRIVCLDLADYASAQTARQAILATLTESSSIEIASAQSDANKVADVHRTQDVATPARPMPRRTNVNPSDDDLDHLLDEFDLADL